MKVLRLASIAAVALASIANAAISYTSHIPSNVIEGAIVAFEGLGLFYANQYMYRGLVRGIQQNPDNTEHPCYTSYIELETQVLNFPNFIAALGNGDGSKNTAASTLIQNVWYRPGTYFSIVKKSSEVGTVYFNMYQQCYLDDLIISLGRTINSFAGSLNTLATVAVYGLNTLDFSSATNHLVNMYSVVKTNNPNNDDVYYYGYYLAQMIKSIFNINVPDAAYNSI